MSEEGEGGRERETRGEGRGWEGIQRVEVLRYADKVLT